jgi:WD40 repeat protein
MKISKTYSWRVCQIKKLYRYDSYCFCECPSTFLQYDINTGEITQEYDQHLGPVNTITFVDENRRFVTTSDDKTIRAWDFDIPVVIKYIAEPHMHSMPAVTLHPSSMSVLDNSLGEF